VDGETAHKLADLPPYPTISEFQFSFAVSPNGQMLAYYAQYLPGHQKHLYIVDANGQVMVDQLIVNSAGEFVLNEWTPGAGELGGYIYWLDNERLMTEKRPTREGIDMPMAFSAVLLEPFIGAIQEFPPIYPGITSQLYSFPTWTDLWIFEAMVFSPDLTRLVYGRDDGGVSLWDLEFEREIIQLQDAFTSGGPTWSQDGLSFIITLPDPEANYSKSQALFQISKDGEITQLTHLGQEFRKVTISNPSWSTDGKQIALRVRLNPDPCTGESIGYRDYPAVINLNELQEVTLYCISNIRMMDFLPLLWSPDGSQLLLPIEHDTVTREFSSILLDIEAGYAATWIEGDYPVAWMSEPQE